MYALTPCLFVALSADRNPFLWLAIYEIGGVVGYLRVLYPHRQFIKQHRQDICDLVFGRKRFWQRRNLPVPTRVTWFGVRSFASPVGESVGFVLFAVASGLAPTAIVVVIRSSRNFFSAFVMSVKMSAYGYRLSRRNTVVLFGALLALCVVVLADADLYSSNALTQTSVAVSVSGLCLAAMSLLLALSDTTVHKRTRLLTEHNPDIAQANDETQQAALLPAVLCSLMSVSVITPLLCLPVVAVLAATGSVSFADYSLIEVALIATAGALISSNAHKAFNTGVLKGKNLKVRVVSFAQPAVAVGYLTLWATFTDYQQNIVWWLFLTGLTAMLALSLIVFFTNPKRRMSAAKLV